MKKIFIKRLNSHLKLKYGKLIENSRIRDLDGSFVRKFMIEKNSYVVSFIIPENNSQEVKIFFANLKSSITVFLNTQNGQYSFTGIPRNISEVKNLYLYAEDCLEEIRYLGNNALDFIMK